jgi:hypothetical protein
MQIHNLAIIFGPSLFCAEERIQGGQQGGGRKATGNDKTGKMGKRKPNDKKGGGFDQTTSIASIEPNQNLAYKMVPYLLKITKKGI